MSTNQETYRTSVSGAHAQKLADLITAKATRQITVDAAFTQVGYLPGFPTGNATYVAAVTAANAAKVAAVITAEQKRQAIIFTAKDLLRSQGETAW